MNIRHGFFRRFLTLILLLIFVPTQFSSLAQVSNPASAHAQVIAQGVQDVPAGDMQWYLRLVTAFPADDTRSTVVTNAFVFTEDGQVLITDSMGDRQLLSPGQATYASRLNPVTVISLSDQPIDLLVVSLEPLSSETDGARSDPISMESGAYNLQLTRGMLNPGESDFFSAQSGLRYVMWVPSGELVVTRSGTTDSEIFYPGDTLESEWDIELRNESTDVSVFVTWSIGDRIDAPVTTVPTTVPSTGFSLDIVFMECASGWVVTDGLGDCFASSDHPNLTISSILGEPVVLSTDWEAVSTAPGRYHFPNLPQGTYFLALDYDPVWDLAKTHWFSDAYSDGLDWFVDVTPANPHPVVTVVLGWVGDGSSSETDNSTDGEDDAIWAPGSMGYAMIVQEECHPGQFDANCSPAVTPWEVYLTHAATGEVYMLSVEGTPMGDGTWMLIVPAGVYWVDVDDAGWYVEYSPQMEVFSGSESYLHITGFAP
ncbi:MAG: hypothetical protein M9953_01345 [Thermomicrobiales bacterium]|nr:hypothetical protein [Thermomicrobiales bacterium]